ncbi:hypothetical protein E8A74_22290 [Polyangium fumosum]|uniref:Uncharacterized protein n=1 Tax=Polyangium fumosum TaxID=889272 RepID=A0A4U1J9G1_9BACT|nr:hypothetical protein E8A74_22290 [Polyangium fumosum]
MLQDGVDVRGRGRGRGCVVGPSDEQGEEMGAAFGFFEEESIIQVLEEVVPADVDDEREARAGEGEIRKILLRPDADVDAPRGPRRERVGRLEVRGLVRDEVVRDEVAPWLGEGANELTKGAERRRGGGGGRGDGGCGRGGGGARGSGSGSGGGGFGLGRVACGGDEEGEDRGEAGEQARGRGGHGGPGTPRRAGVVQGVEGPMETRGVSRRGAVPCGGSWPRAHVVPWMPALP